MERKEAIKVLKDFWSVYEVGTEIREAFETLVPELKESEEEWIRKALIELVRKHCVNETRCMMEEWLGKQCKKKPVEPSVKDKEMVHYISNAISEPDASAYLKENNIKVIDAHVWLENILFEDRTGFPPQWKPSDEQMTALSIIKDSGNSHEHEVLDSLYYDLKKLKG